MLERDPQLVAALRASRARLRADAVSIERTESLSWMRGAARRFQLVLLDPPFDDPAILGLALQAAAHLVADSGYVYVEAAAPLEVCPDGFLPWRQSRAGAVHFQLLQRKSSG
jgi:16S rRNA G966 N2-methylase RsmD